jgi:glycosyltransferase involved in cell wall biosynthesis
VQRTVVAFGHFDLEGGRSWMIRTGLERHGYRVALCRTEQPGLRAKYRDLKTQWKSIKHADAIYVPFSGAYLLPLARKLGRKRGIPVVIDAFLSLFDTEVQDRRRLSRFHPKAWALWMLDGLCGRLADAMLLDTPEHKDYFVRTFGIRPDRILVLPVGCRTDLFTSAPPRKPDGVFRVEFHGTFIPLHGIGTILRAASLLQKEAPDVRFTLIGRGQTYPDMRALAQKLSLGNVEFLDPVPITKLPAHIAAADVCLGIFGDTAKAGRVIPNKAYEILASRRPLLTGDTPAARRIFTDGMNAALCRVADPRVLADAILRLRDDPALRARIADAGQALSAKRFQPETVTAPLDAWLKQAWAA